jgi:hypothetical protein
MRAVVSLANDRGNYHKALDRLAESIRLYGGGIHFFGFRSEEEVGAPPHLENPYAFKLYAIEKVRNMGYTQILWLDSSVYAVADIAPAFWHIDSFGYLMQDSGHVLGDWSNDELLNYSGLNRTTAMSIKMYGNAGMLGLDFNNIPANLFFDMWKDYMNLGLFKGSWDNHRHDMSCGSLIAWALGLNYIPGDKILQYAAPGDPLLNETIIFKAQGL